MKNLIQSRKYPWMYYIKYPEGGRSYEYYNLTRASYAAICIYGITIEPKKVGQLA